MTRKLPLVTIAALSSPPQGAAAFHVPSFSHHPSTSFNRARAEPCLSLAAKTQLWMTSGTKTEDGGNDQAKSWNTTSSIDPTSSQKISAIDARLNWNRITEPFDVARDFVVKSIEDDEIRQVLHDNEIKTMYNLRNRFGRIVAFVMRKGEEIDEVEFDKAIEAALGRLPGRPEDALGGKPILDSSCFRNYGKAANHYSPEAVAVKPLDAEGRRLPFSIVLGSSGSGKSMFALKRAGQLIFNTPDATTICSVHFKADTITKSDMARAGSFPLAVANYVELKIADRVSNYPRVNAFDLCLHVIIDEAGKEAYKAFFDKGDKIRDICNALENMRYKFQQGCHVTIVGTGLEVTTALIDSICETVKFRMQPWSAENFEAFLETWKLSEQNHIKDIVKSFAILKGLTSNARCAFYLVDSMPGLSHLSWYQKQCLAGIITSNVAQNYANDNGLKELRSARDKVVVARSVFRTLNDAIMRCNEAFFPQFTDISEKHFRPVAKSLVEVNVESINGTLGFMNKESPFAVSITPAITIVLAELIGENAFVLWGWEEFESIPALGEFKTMIANMEESDVVKGVGGIVCLSSPFPGKSKTTFSVPEVRQSTVLKNGPKAQFADVIAPFRLVQAKFSINSDQLQELNITFELDKMGVTTNLKFRVQQTVLSCLYMMWVGPPMSSLNDLAVGCEVLSSASSSVQRCEHYPFVSLLSAVTVNYPMIDVTLDDNKAEAVIINNSTWTNPIKVLHVFDKNPVTALFVTNCKGFALKREGKGEDKKDAFCICNEDVDWQGKVKGEKVLPADVLGGLRPNVEIRFMFY